MRYRARVDEDFVCIMQELKGCRAVRSLGLCAEQVSISVPLWAVFHFVPQSPFLRLFCHCRQYKSD